MPFISRDDAQSIVQPYFADFQYVVAAAWKDWRDGVIAAQMQHKRVRANYIWNQLIAHAKRRFDGNSNVQVETLRTRTSKAELFESTAGGYFDRGEIVRKGTHGLDPIHQNALNEDSNTVIEAMVVQPCGI